jgi:hypothetical protein
MSNERNVEALAALLCEHWGDSTGTMVLAEFLAARGVLVPASLSDEEVDELTDGARAGDIHPSTSRRQWRDDLARIARGEP